MLYENVIVPFDGSLPARAALAPAADLAWRCGARVVIISTADADDRGSVEMLKSTAMSLSGADVDFWVDTGTSQSAAVLAAVDHRRAPVVCMPIRHRGGAILRKPLLTATAAEVLIGAPCPVLVIGPETDVSRGLPLTELVVGLDGSRESEAMLPVAVAWGEALRLRVTLLGVVRGSGTHTEERGYLARHHGALAAAVPDSGVVLFEAEDPADGIVEYLSGREDAVMALSTHGRGGLDRYPLGSVAQAVMLRSPRATLFMRPPH